MSTDIVTVPRSARLREVVERLLEHEVGSVIVLSEEGHPVGIITESDTMEAVYRTGDTLEDIDVETLVHRPVITTKPTATVPHVAHRMTKEDVKKAPVMEDLDLVGIVAMTDIVWHLADLRKEASELGEAYNRWKPR